jgi:hypothetical protein
VKFLPVKRGVTCSAIKMFDVVPSNNLEYQETKSTSYISSEQVSSCCCILCCVEEFLLYGNDAD